jgi:hypothetical protein
MTRQDTSDLNAVDVLIGDDDGTVDLERRDKHQALSTDADALRSHPEDCRANYGEVSVVRKRRALDRAAAVTSNIMHMITTAPANEQLQLAVEDCLRDEFADVARQIAAERESDHA